MFHWNNEVCKGLELVSSDILRLHNSGVAAWYFVSLDDAVELKVGV